MPNARQLCASLLTALAILGAGGGVGANASYRVVVDPGHGGRDGGAQGRVGTREKDVTLSVSLMLRDILERMPDIDVTLTRERDVAVRLRERVRIARDAAANLFISIHADSIRVSSLRGASIYTLADEASDEIAASLAEDQEQSDALAGFESSENTSEVTDILLDLMRRETEAFSRDAAGRFVGALGRQTRMIGNPHRSANFRVLRAPDVPSILVELGYLSNRRDERQLRDPEWQAKIAQALADAIVAHARETGALRDATE